MADTMPTQVRHEALLDSALDLLRDSRYHGADPGLARTYGQRRRRLMDAIIEDQQQREEG